MQLAGRPPGNQCYLVIIRCNLRVITAVTTLEDFWTVMWHKKQWPRWCLQVFIVTLLEVGDINLILWIISDQASRQKLGTLLRSHVRQNRNRDGGQLNCVYPDFVTSKLFELEVVWMIFDQSLIFNDLLGGWACGRGCGEAQASEIWRNDEVSFCTQPLLYFDWYYFFWHEMTPPFCSKDYYFDSYAHFGIHEEMLKDEVKSS